MKEYIGTDGIPVVEYELEDIPKLINGELPWIFGLVKTQRNSEGGESTWFRFTPEAEKVWNENKEAQEKTYWAKVDSQLEQGLKPMFLHLLKKSSDKAGMIADRIREGQWKLEPDKDPTAPSELGLNPRSHLKDAWLILKRGQREHHLLNAHYMQLTADTENLFLQWLKELQTSVNNAETATDSTAQPAQANTPPQGNEGGTGAEIEPLTSWQAAYLLAYKRRVLEDPRNLGEKADARIYARDLCKLTAKNSGYQLYQRTTYLRKPTDRDAFFNSAVDASHNGEKYHDKSPKSFLKDIETIIPLLEGEQKAEAERDLKKWISMI